MAVPIAYQEVEHTGAQVQGAIEAIVVVLIHFAAHLGVLSELPSGSLSSSRHKVLAKVLE
ncbi:hypothetical protein [Paraflavitalea speifideaquila]|uniref:hypothetical protein n=1 Tax=Paraflavitalea speifideaquila TaxID=3076558 RepID=UPI0028E274C1|nr:hypothetical protein [Paraflavitalea speifideiaquila]